MEKAKNKKHFKAVQVDFFRPAQKVPQAAGKTPLLIDYFDSLFLHKGLADFLRHPGRPIFWGFNNFLPSLEHLNFFCPAFSESNRYRL